MDSIFAAAKIPLGCRSSTDKSSASKNAWKSAKFRNFTKTAIFSCLEAHNIQYWEKTNFFFMEWKILSISSFSIIYVMLQYFSISPILAVKNWNKICFGRSYILVIEAQSGKIWIYVIFWLAVKFVVGWHLRYLNFQLG